MRFRTPAEARRAIFDFIEGWYWGALAAAAATAGAGWQRGNDRAQ